MVAELASGEAQAGLGRFVRRGQALKPQTPRLSIPQALNPKRPKPALYTVNPAPDLLREPRQVRDVLRAEMPADANTWDPEPAF